MLDSSKIPIPIFEQFLSGAMRSGAPGDVSGVDGHNRDPQSPFVSRVVQFLDHEVWVVKASEHDMHLGVWH